MSKHLYTVSMPFTGVATTQVEADDDQDAVELATEVIGQKLRFKNQIGVDVEWDLTETIVMGNVFYGIQNKVDIVDEGPVDGDEDEEEPVEGGEEEEP